VETPPLAAVRVNILRVPASRAEDLDGIVAAWRTSGLDCRRHARTVRPLGAHRHRPKGTTTAPSKVSFRPRGAARGGLAMRPVARAWLRNRTPS